MVNTREEESDRTALDEPGEGFTFVLVNFVYYFLSSGSTITNSGASYLRPVEHERCGIPAKKGRTGCAVAPVRLENWVAP